MTDTRIEQDLEGCIGCGACASICPDSWEMKETPDGEYKAYPLKKKCSEEVFDENMEAAESCPVTVIHLFDGEGKQLI